MSTMNTITKKLLVDQIAQRTGQKRVVVKQIVQEFLDQVIDEIEQGNRLEFRDFGVFEVRERAPRMAQNPKTLERVPVPAKRTVKFKPGRRMREGLEAPAQPASAVETKANDNATAAAARARTAEPQAEIHVSTTPSREEAVTAS